MIQFMQIFTVSSAFLPTTSNNTCVANAVKQGEGGELAACIMMRICTHPPPPARTTRTDSHPLTMSISALLAKEKNLAGDDRCLHFSTHSLINIDGHNRRWIDGSIPIVSIDTIDRYFWSHFHRCYRSIG
jgi:hypothetical protein